MIRVGLIGAGYIGEVHAEAWSRIPKAKLVAVTAKRWENAARLARRFGARAHREAESLLADVDVADVCVPTFLHERFVVMAALAGKHVLCEKPLALSLSAADRIIEVVERARIKFMVAHVMRFWPEYRVIKALVDEGKIGRLLCISVQRVAQAPTWAQWLHDPERSGGVALDLMIHDLDFVSWLSGTPIAVYARGLQAQNGVPDHVLATVSYESGCEAFVEGSWRMPTGFPFTIALRALGTGGCVEFFFRAWGGLKRRLGVQRTLVLFTPGKPPEQLPVEDKDPYAAEVEYFADCVLECRDPTLVTPSEARAAVALSLAVRESLQSDKVVNLFPRHSFG